MKPAVVTREMRIAAASYAADSYPAEFIAGALGVTVERAAALVVELGGPDPAALRASVARLRAEVSAAAAPPVRVTPSPSPAYSMAAARPVKPQLPAARVMERVPLHRLVPDPDNPRESIGDIVALAAAMRSVGLVQPVVARPLPDGRLGIVAGHRRVAAAQLLRWPAIDVIIRRDLRPDDVLATMLIENSHRRDLDAIEEARGLRRVLEQLGGPDVASHADVARRVGRTQVHVSGRLALLALPVEEQEQVRAGTTSLTEATARARLAAGKVRPHLVGRTSPQHLGVGHALAHAAKARCLRLRHSRGKGKGVGGIACGACWESVIRADEREQMHAHGLQHGLCPVCRGPVAPAGPGAKAAVS
ncbi:MAG: ParB/RepB/Spo0J family partition protein [Dermatophilaceae bacterium]|nr:ParB/RepB/Spo0J family partition protein [Dermatophilaceae bacterium]